MDLPFTEQEKARIRHFLGYPSWQSLAASIQLGVPAASQTAWLVNDAFSRFNEAGMATIRTTLCNCEACEAQLGAARARMAARKIGNIELNPGETTQLRLELIYWSRKLAEDMGCQYNPFGAIATDGMPGGVNANVSG